MTDPATRAGALVRTTASIQLELCGDARHPNFKAIQEPIR